MKIAQIVASLETRHGGPGKSVRQMSDALAKAGDEVDLLATGIEPYERSGNPFVRVFKRNRPEKICPSRNLALHLKNNAYEIIHNHGLWLRTVHYAHAAAKRSGIPFVLSPRGMMSDWAWNHRRTRKWFGEHFLHPNAIHDVAGWHATSQQEADDIKKRGCHQPVCIASNSVEIPEIDAMRDHRSRWLTTLPDTQDRPIALFYSRFHRKKRVLELIDLWTRINTRDWLLLIVGIPEEYTANAISNYVVNSGVQRKILVYSGLHRPPPYPVASLYLLPSHSENFGLTIAEALANGVPALVTDSTPWEGLADQEAGWCVRWENYEKTLVDALKLPPETLGLMGHRGRNWVSQTFSWDITAKKMHDFYASLKPAK